MFRIKHSISRKFTRLLFVVLLLTSLLLSTSFYFISISIFNSYVMPQINKILTAAAQDVYKNLNVMHAQQTLNKNDQSATNLEFYFQEKRKQHGVETIFLVNLKGKKLRFYPQITMQNCNGQKVSPYPLQCNKPLKEKLD